MAFTSLYALHKDGNGQIVDAGAFDYSFKLRDWVGSLDVRPGDTIEFGEKAARPSEPVDLANVEPLAIVPTPEKIKA